jgi:hypothetical protein
MNMVSIGLAIPSTRFPPVERTWKFTPLSHEPGAICTWETGETGQGAIAIASLNPPIHMHTHVRSTCMLWVASGSPKPVLGETLANSPRAVYPLDFLVYVYNRFFNFEMHYTKLLREEVEEMK